MKSMVLSGNNSSLCIGSFARDLFYYRRTKNFNYIRDRMYTPMFDVSPFVNTFT